MPETLRSINGTSLWARERGFRPFQRSAIRLAIAVGELKAVEVDAGWMIREDDAIAWYRHRHAARGERLKVSA